MKEEESPLKMTKMKRIIDLLLENPYSPIANRIASTIGLQVVMRQGKPYVRRIPERLTGKALDSAAEFGYLNHKNRGKEGQILLPNHIEQNTVAFESSQEMKGTKFKIKPTEREKIEQLLEEENH